MKRQGLIDDMPEDEYHRGPEDEMSVSLAKLMLPPGSPAHMRYAWENPDITDSDVKKFGRCFHAAVLQPERYNDMVAVRPVEITQRRGKAWEAFAEEHKTQDIITQDEQDEITGMVNAIFAHPLAWKLLDGARTEVSGFFTDPTTGVKCRLRTDAMHEGHAMACDVKKVTAVDSQTLGKTFSNFNYHMQQAWYEDGLRTLEWPCDHFVYICVEQEPPHAVRMCLFNKDDVQLGRTLNERARLMFAACLERGEWPSYPTDIHTIEMPPWSRRLPT